MSMIGANTGPQNGLISGHRPIPKMQIWHNASQYVAKGLTHPWGIRNSWNNKFWGIEGGRPGGDIYIHIYIVSRYIYTALLNPWDAHIYTSVTRAQAHTIPWEACGLPCTRRAFCIHRMPVLPFCSWPRGDVGDDGGWINPFRALPPRRYEDNMYIYI